MATLDIAQAMAAHYGIGACGLAASYVLTYGLWQMSATTTSSYGVRIAGAAMLMAVLAGCLYMVGAESAASSHWQANSALAAAALALGAGAAWWRARKPALAALPQLTVLFNGMGAAAAAAIASLELFGRRIHGPADLAIALTAAWLAVTSIAGSLLAWAALGGIMRFTLRLRARRALLAVVLSAAAALGYCIVNAMAADAAPFLPLSELAGLLFGCALLCALLVTFSISTADMPVAVSMINAVAAVSVALVGIVLRMPALTIVGTLVAGAGIKLAQLRANWAGRTIMAALLGDGGAGSRESRSLGAGDAAIFMKYARKVVVVPGYGLAAAQGQHKLQELIKLLMAAGVEVKVALHPMAGRMPGQMAALLGDAHVPDELTLPFPDIDEGLRGADVALVIGANDVVNPSANAIKSLPMFGIPSLGAGTAGKIYVVKRAAGRGYSGIDNPAFQGENCDVIYGDAQIVLIKMVEALRAAEFPVAA